MTNLALTVLTSATMLISSTQQVWVSLDLTNWGCAQTGYNARVSNIGLCDTRTNGGAMFFRQITN